MKKMTNGLITLNITEWIMTVNCWEYYVTDDQEDDIALCLVHGFETEMGNVDLGEIAPYIRARSKELEIAPAIGWKWVE